MNSTELFGTALGLETPWFVQDVRDVETLTPTITIVAPTRDGGFNEAGGVGPLPVVDVTMKRYRWNQYPKFIVEVHVPCVRWRPDGFVHDVDLPFVGKLTAF
jgi:hypothetical protein